ncbi:Pyridine nucleotide-disulphide oxidoreductase [Gemmobacter megaterium]|uniref:Pyridine nucleotide-disulphide oxidoreductase n=1 Tax=Gemmobacter megaterium TaxID=1086013 RepID=A0A1N7KGF4_9RHOB|nr:NAD(P)-binding domain-containing protein [Gemmobacter megaterium]GGE02011.1 FAD-dependent oxidoreductase [Gemmobacter megaterium]SIS60655.1 Pyridine nucleotide-disulphide oxidoreductase [Gemmobacter megaterium]
MAKTVAILGAGPVGLAAAAHVLERGMTPLILEQGDTVAHAVRAWRHVPMFSNWRYNIDTAAARLLQRNGWLAPDPEAHPTGADLISSYLEPLGRSLSPWLRLNQRVVAVARDGLDKVKNAGRATTPFVVATEGPEGRTLHRAEAVIDTTGTWFQPNPGGAGLMVPGEAGHPQVDHGMPDIQGQARARYQGRRVGVLGGGHSAIGNLMALAALPGTVPVWLCRADSVTRALGGGAADQLAARGALGLEMARLVSGQRVVLETGFRLSGIEGTDPMLAVASDGRRIALDALIISTGFRPDLAMLREVRVALDPALECPPALAPLIDPNLHSCGTVRPHGAAELAHPEPGFFIAGMKSYGRAPTFLLATGHEQVRSIAAALAGDHAAAARVELVLPETGVCSGPSLSAVAAVAAAGCCGDPAPAGAKGGCGAEANGGSSSGSGSGRGASAGCGPATPKGAGQKAGACC